LGTVWESKLISHMSNGRQEEENGNTQALLELKRKKKLVKRVMRGRRRAGLPTKTKADNQI